MSTALIARPIYVENEKSLFLASMRFRTTAFRQALGIMVLIALLTYFCLSKLMAALNFDYQMGAAFVVLMACFWYLVDFSTEAEDAKLMKNLMTISDYEQEVPVSFAGSAQFYKLSDLKVVKCLIRLDKDMGIQKRTIYANADDQRVMMNIQCTNNDFSAELSRDANQMHIFMQKYS